MRRAATYPPLRVVNPQHIIYDNAARLAADIKFPDNSRYDVVVGGDFIFGDFIEAFVVGNRAFCERMVISTLSLSQDNVDSLSNLVSSGLVKRLDLLVSDYFYSHERNALVPYIYETLDIDGRFQMAVCSTHMKTTTFETRGGKKIVMHGSANLRSSGSIEQFTIEDNAGLYDFYNGVTDKILERYATIKKSIRGRAGMFNLIKQERR